MFYGFIIHQVDWIDNTAKNSALEKLNMMRSVIAYPDELLNDTKLNEFYQTIELTKGNFFENYLNVSLFNTLRSYSSLRIPLDRYHWTQVDRGETMSAIYNRVQNFICKYIRFSQKYEKCSCNLFLLFSSKRKKNVELKDLFQTQFKKSIKSRAKKEH